jgi:2',3'-cyclic-nucleotide 2'-phosphodiesterase (5'-nucleotidase family)
LRRLGPLLVLLAGCTPATPNGKAAPQLGELTILYTSDEHGWIQPTLHEGVRRGGASQFLWHLVNDESACTGALPPAARPDCTASDTLLLSGGDNFTGPAISSFFQGEPMARVMARLGYVVSAFGNHELDFGAERFRKSRELSAVRYLAANVQGAGDLVAPYEIVERSGVRVGVIGLSTPSTPRTAAAHRFKEMTFEPIEATLERIVPEVWLADVDAIVVVVHECHDVLVPIVAAHPDWNLSFVGTGHCHRTSVEIVGDVPVIGPDWRLEHYARVRIAVDRGRAARERASLIDYELMEIASDAYAPPKSADAALDQAIGGWAAEIERALGEVIGYSAVGLGKRSAAIGQWIVGAWLAGIDADVAVSTDGAIRQELPAGPISLATISSILPFDNELVVTRIAGAELAPMLEHADAIVGGLRKTGDTWLDATGKPLDPARTYRVVTSDFLYWGGDGFDFHVHDREPLMTGVNWRDPVVKWTRDQKSAEGRPLEGLIR